MNKEKIIKRDLWFLSGGGEMGQLIREKDWSKTPLGPPDSWPQSLRTMVAVMLDNPFGMYIAWGNDYTQLYNDGYRPILGATKHPEALGISTRETFSEIWHIIESMFDGVMNGTAVGFPDLMLPLNRNGFVEECYFDFAYSPIRKDNGEVGGVLVTVIETTEKKRATEALKESNARFINNIMQAPVAMCILRGKNYVVEIANEQMLNLWGKHADQIMNKPIFEGLPEAKDQGLESLLDSVFTTGEKFIANERPVNLPRNGKVETTYINFVYEALKEPDGTISGIAAIAIEVTPQVVSRFRIEESEQKVRALVENAPFPIAVYVGKEMIVELANPSIIDIWGKGNDVIGKSFKELLPELDNQSVFEQIQKVLETGESFHTKNTPLDLIIDGKPYTYYFNYSFTPLYDISGNIYGVMNTGVDLTELNIAKKKIEESEEQLRIAIEGGEFGTFDFIPEGNQLIWSAKTKELFGLPPNARVDYETYIAALHPEDRGTSAIAKQQGDLKLGGLYELEYRTIGVTDGKLRWLRSQGKATYDKEGKAIRYTGVIQDITTQKESAEKVRESNQRFRNTMKQAPVGITILRGPEYIVEMANDAYLQLVGKKEAEFVGNPLFRSLPEVEEAVHSLLDNVLHTGVPYHGNEVAIPLNRYGKPDVFYFDFLYHALKEEDGKISGVIAIVTEVTEKVEARKLIEESEEKFRLLADSIPQHIWTSDPQGNLNYYNQSVFHYSGLTLEQINKDGWIQIVHPDDRDENIKTWINSVSTGKDFLFEHRFRRYDGEYRWQLSRATPQRDEAGNIQMWVGTSTDIHDKKVTEVQLDKLVKERTVQLERSNEDLQQFAHVASHDLKEPLRKIKLFTDRAKEEYAESLPVPVVNFLEKITDASTRMQMMVDGVLSFSSVNSTEQPVQKIDLNDTFKNVKNDLEIVIEQKKANIICGDLPTVEGGAILINQLFYNLLHNSLKFSKENEAPLIEVSSVLINEGGRDHAKVLIKDNGIGFNQSNARQIFETFVRLNSKDKYEGTGLGLTLCKKIVERHNGSIEATSKEKEGTIFIITLPIKQMKKHI